MRIDYWILVVDDQPRDVESVRDSIAAFLEDEGMALRWEAIGTNDALTAELAHDRRLGIAPDLVLVDNRLGEHFGGEHGPNWAAAVRRAFPYTDILFYSSAGLVRELREEIFRAGVDGVFSCNRATLDAEAKQLIGVHIQRWLEAPATRALVVGQVVEFDERFRELSARYGDAVDRDVLEGVVGKYAAEAESNVRKKAVRFAGYRDAVNLVGLLHDPDLGSHWLPDVARELVGLTDRSVYEALTAFMVAYRDNVLAVRNVLAHGRYDPERKTFVGARGREFAATASDCRRLRVGLRAYRDAIERLASDTTPGEAVPPPPPMPSLL
jgi:CheY-like chemotaxis protein